jgi:O-antigen ligase
MITKTTRYLIYLTILLLPAYLFRLSIFGIPTNVSEVLALLVFLSYLVDGKYSPFEFCRSHKAIILAVAAIFSGFVVSMLISHNYLVGLGIIKSWFIAPLVFAWVVYEYKKSEEILINVYKWLYLSILWVAVLSLIYYFTGHLTYDGRLQGIFNSPNYLAMYLAPGLIIGAYLMQNLKIKNTNNPEKSATAGNVAGNGKIKITFFVISFTVTIIAFYLTYSYAAWTAVVLSLIITSMIRNKKINKKAVLASMIIILLLIISQLDSEKLNNFKNSPRSSLASRIMIWNSATKILGDNIVFGIGPGNFQNKYLEYQKYFPLYLEWAVPHPHNLCLAFWLYGGFLSLAGFLALLFFWFQKIIKKEKNSLWAISFAVMLYFLLHGLVDTTYFKNDLAFVFWLNFIILL